MSRRTGAAAVLLAALTALGGCSSAGTTGAGGSSSLSPSASAAAQERACWQAAADVISAVRDRVSAYEITSSSAAPSSSASPGSASPRPSASATTQLDPLTAAVASARDTMTQQKCSESDFSAHLQQGLDSIHPTGTIAKAVLARISATLMGRVGQSSETKSVRPTEDLGQALAEVAAGSTIDLQAGTYKLSDPLVLLDGVTIEGAGKAKTTIRSTAGDAAIVVATQARVELKGLALQLSGKGSASGVVAGASTRLVLTNVRISGARADKSQGGAGVQMSAAAGQAAGTQTTLEVTGSQFDHNAWAGITLSGGHRVSIEKSTFSDNGQCGVCFLDASSGSVQHGTFTDNAVAVGVTGTAAPILLASTITGGTVGIQVAEKAKPIIDDVRITGAARAAAIFSGTSSGSVTHVTCVRDKFDIAIATTAAPTVGDNSCALVRGK